MSSLTYRHENTSVKKIKGVNHKIYEKITDGTDKEKGLSIYYFSKAGEDDSKFYSFDVKQTDTDKFVVKEKKADKESSSDVDSKGLVTLVKANKHLGEFGDHLVNYLSKERGTYKGVKASKKASEKKASEKKASKKASKKKASKKQVGGTKKASKKASKKQVGGAKKASKKAPKKASKKGSKKGSKKQAGGAKKNLNTVSKKPVHCDKKKSDKLSKKKSSKKD